MTNNAPAPGEIVGYMDDGTAIRQARPDPEEIVPGSDVLGLFSLQTAGADSLSKTEFPKLRQPVEGLIPEGCTLLCGAPKMGKSWLSLGMCCAVATGSSFLGRKTDQCTVLYLDLEEGPRLVHERIKALDVCLSDNLRICSSAPGVDDGLFVLLDRWMEENPDTGLIVIDTFQLVRGAGSARDGVYKQDYNALFPFKQFADKHHIALVLVHHQNKRTLVDDPLDRVSGSSGMSGAVDQVLTLSRKRGEADATLFCASRIIRGGESTIRFNNGRWTAIGPDVLRRERYDSDPLVKACRALLSTCMGRSVERTFGDFKEYAAQMAGTAVAGTEREISNKLHDLELDLMEFDGIQIEFRPRVTGSNGKRSGGFRLH